MKPKILLILFSLVLLFGCSNNDDGLTDGVETFILRPETKIVAPPQGSGNNVTFTEGDKIVFHYSLQRPENPDRSDDELTENIVFEIDSNLNTFDYSNQELIPLLTYYFESCFCLHEVVEIISGHVSGQKINETKWNLTLILNISLQGSTITKNISGDFLSL